MKRNNKRLDDRGLFCVEQAILIKFLGVWFIGVMWAFWREYKFRNEVNRW
ncbi:hypothetical protein HMPREF0663_11943 [Hoylesella oralis ATCC 33269]|uniref:Uncharacterized protein n=1 Tax=Hoylesella oralis ATCC 33269 TaxID=873533 RepID=E7RRZ2_9BACT|nr:hypothetical protein HMPREF0663_11943 [Hoylesella oralis ATCC 33269]